MGVEARNRARIIGLAGPAVQAVGFVWEAIDLLVVHGGRAVSARHLAFEPGVLLLFVGLLISVVCVPLALELSQASDEDLQIPEFGVGDRAEAKPAEAAD